MTYKTKNLERNRAICLAVQAGELVKVVAKRYGFKHAKTVYDIYRRRSVYLPNREGPPVPKKVLIAIQPSMLEQIDYIAQTEHRTRSDLVREALRRYLENFRRAEQGLNRRSESALAIDTPTLRS